MQRAEKSDHLPAALTAVSGPIPSATPSVVLWIASATTSAVAISPKCRVASASKWLAAQAGRTWWTCLLIKKNSAYPVATASNTAHQEETPKLSGKIGRIVSP